MSEQRIRLERSYPATAERVWELWTTAAGIESWWAPDGFTAEVTKLELRPGGELVYSFTATEPAQVEFMRQAGLPLTTEACKTFTEIEPPSRLGYTSRIDFVPDVEPYDHLTVVELTPTDDGVRVDMTMDPLHDDVWTQRIIEGRENELANLARILEGDQAA